MPHVSSLICLVHVSLAETEAPSTKTSVSAEVLYQLGFSGTRRFRRVKTLFLCFRPIRYFVLRLRPPRGLPLIAQNIPTRSLNSADMKEQRLLSELLILSLWETLRLSSGACAIPL